MKKLMKLTAFVCALILLLVLVIPQVHAGTVSVTFTNTPKGYKTQLFPGVDNGCGRWNVNDLVDLGMKSIRWWGGFYSFAPVDPDGVYGKNTAAQINGSNGITTAKQIVTGLSPNTTYRLTGYIKSLNGPTATFGVRNYGGSEISQTTASTTYQLLTLTFTTGTGNTTAEIFLTNSSSSNKQSLCADVISVTAQ